VKYVVYHKNEKYKELVQHKTIMGLQLVYENDIYFLYYCWVGTSQCSHKWPSCTPQHKRCTSHQLLQPGQHCNSQTALLHDCAV